jgi:hypothetical protein
MKWKLQGWDTFARHSYSISGSYESEAEAVAAAKKKLKELERHQPTLRSGGQGGIQDQVYVIGPDGQNYRVLP